MKLPKILFPKLSLTERVSLCTVKLLLLFIRMFMFGFVKVVSVADVFVWVVVFEVVFELLFVLGVGGFHWFILNKVNRIVNPRCRGRNGSVNVILEL